MNRKDRRRLRNREGIPLVDYLLSLATPQERAAIEAALEAGVVTKAGLEQSLLRGTSQEGLVKDIRIHPTEH
jgi:hypothetical protein